MGKKKLALFFPLCRVKMTKLEKFMQMSESEGDRAKLVQRQVALHNANGSEGNQTHKCSCEALSSGFQWTAMVASLPRPSYQHLAQRKQIAGAIGAKNPLGRL